MVAAEKISSMQFYAEWMNREIMNTHFNSYDCMRDVTKFEKKTFLGTSWGQQNCPL